ncbi:MAG TPA: DUF4082 domain-containing protein [Chloroflexota bacterium]|nr:DUF4082 domain-containing protein [Chloroflexota bacterium]
MEVSQHHHTTSPDLAAIVAALTAQTEAMKAQEAEMAALRAEVQQLRAAQVSARPVVSTTATGLTNRRALLTRAAGAVAATVGAGALLDAQHGTARADGTEGATTFTTNGSIAISVQCTAPDGTGIGVTGPGTSEAADYWGIASFVTNGIGVHSTSSTGTAVFGYSDGTTANATAIVGTIGSTSPGGFSSAVRGVNNGTGGLGIGVWGSQAGSGWGGYFTSAGGIGVNADGGSGTGVNASGATGITAFGSTIGVSGGGSRGGVFSGQAAQVQLAQGSAATHPTSGAAGDLYVDSTARLWFCRGGTSWVELTAVAAPPTSIFTTQTPAATYSGAYELGVKFRSSVAGHLTGLRFYKPASETGSHVGHLWSATGTLLGTVTFTNETASGWQTATFSTPIAISANTTYVASVNSNTALGYTASALSISVTNGSLSTVVGNNGVYSTTRGAFPTTGTAGTNYFRDVIFTAP